MTPRTRWRKTIILARLGDPTLTALAMSDYGNERGEEIRVSAERIAAGLPKHPGTVRRHQQFLIETGWLEVTKQGGTKGGPRVTEFRACIPVGMDLEELRAEVDALAADLTSRRLKPSDLPRSLYHAHESARLTTRTRARGAAQSTDDDHARSGTPTTRFQRSDHARSGPRPRARTRDYQGDHVDHVDTQEDREAEATEDQEELREDVTHRKQAEQFEADLATLEEFGRTMAAAEYRRQGDAEGAHDRVRALRALAHLDAEEAV